MTTRPTKSTGHGNGWPPANLPPPSLFQHRFQRPELLLWALTHRSLSYETASKSPPEPSTDPTTDNEQLEFLGDAILGLLAAEALFQRFPQSREGELTRLRASLVSSRNLANVAARIGLGDHIRLGRGEDASGGRAKPALLANALEAIIAALYLDGGLPVARAFVAREIVEPALPELQAAVLHGNTVSGTIGDHKSALQEHLQATGAGQPQYVLTDQSGPDHAKRFRVEVRVTQPDGTARPLAESEASTKKQAQQQAARLAFEKLLAEQMAAQPPQPPVKTTPSRAKRAIKPQPESSKTQSEK